MWERRNKHKSEWAGVTTFDGAGTCAWDARVRRACGILVGHEVQQKKAICHRRGHIERGHIERGQIEGSHRGTRVGPARRSGRSRLFSADVPSRGTAEKHGFVSTKVFF